MFLRRDLRHMDDYYANHSYSGGQKRQYGLVGVPIFSGATTGDEAKTGCVVVELTPLVAATCTTGIGVGGICATGSTVGGGGVKILPVS